MRLVYNKVNKALKLKNANLKGAFNSFDKQETINTITLIK